jgi:hypothetical protein
MRPLRRVLRRGLIVGLLLVALAGILQPRAAEASHACAVDETGHRGWRICETMPGRVTYEGRKHIFVVGTDYAIWYAWQRWAGGPYSTWHTLGGQAYHNEYEGIYASVYARLSTYFTPTIYVKVLGTNLNFYCKSYDFHYPGWSPWYRTTVNSCPDR